MYQIQVVECCITLKVQVGWHSTEYTCPSYFNLESRNAGRDPVGHEELINVTALGSSFL